MSPKTAPGPRERLLAAGQQLFYSRGASVGVDALLKEANVARRSLYEHFGGKDGLIEAVLRRAAEEDLAWYENALAGADGTPSPASRALRPARRTRLDRGLPRLSGTSRPTFPSRIPAIRHMQRQTAFRRRLRALLVRELEAMGHARPARAAEQLHLLIEGTLVMGATQDGQHPGRAARDLAALVIG